MSIRHYLDGIVTWQLKPFSSIHPEGTTEDQDVQNPTQIKSWNALNAGLRQWHAILEFLWMFNCDSFLELFYILFHSREYNSIKLFQT